MNRAAAAAARSAAALPSRTVTMSIHEITCETGVFDADRTQLSGRVDMPPENSGTFDCRDSAPMIPSCFLTRLAVSQA